MMLGVLVLIGVTIYNLRGQALPSPPAPPTKGSLSFAETIVPGPTDKDPEEREAAQELLDHVEDASAKRPSPLKLSDMPAYWTLVRWVLAQSFAELEERAQRIPFTVLWEKPEKHRAEIVKMRMHVQRVIKWDDPPENEAGVKATYDVWGWTEDSQTNPYVVVATELPPGFPEGSDVRAEAVVIGYFLKIMSYQGGDNKLRGTPVIVGRVRFANVPQPPGANVAGSAGQKSGKRSGGLGAITGSGSSSWLITAGATALLAMLFLASWVFRFTRRSRRAGQLSQLPSRPSVDVESWLERFPAEATEESRAEERARAESNGSAGNGQHS